MVACMLSDCQYVQTVNFGYWVVIIIYCAVAIMYSIIIIIII